MSKKNVIVALMVVIGLGLLIGGAVFALQDDKDSATDTAKTTAQPTELEQTEKPETSTKTGMFTGVAPKTGSGSVSLITNTDGSSTVKLGEDFTVQEGPDLYVSFGNNNEVDHDTLFSELKAFTGAQEYTVPDSLDVSKYNQVIIYCKEFSVVFSTATLQ